MKLIPNEILSSENISDKGIGITVRNFDAIIIDAGQAGPSLAGRLNASRDY